MAEPIPREWLHPASLQEATAVQRLLAGRVVTEDAFSPIRRVGGADISCNARDPGGMVHAALVTLDLPGLAVAATAAASGPSDFPYIPGFLAFRETPFLVEAFRRMESPPDLIFVDGHGISHPRGLGIASHFGVLIDRPTVGVAKSILIGRPEGELGPEPGDSVPLVWKGRQVGAVLRTRRNVKPVFVSVGHRISLASALEWVMRTARGYRLPEPTRQAHLAANVLRKGA